MRRIRIVAMIVIATASGAVAQQAPTGPEKAVEGMLQDFVRNYERKVSEDLSFSVRITVKPVGESWRILVSPGRDVRLVRGGDVDDQLRFTTDLETLRRIHAGSLSALTAAAQAKSSDPAPLKVGFAESAKGDPNLRLNLYKFVQHFFNRSDPERIVLRKENARIVHGAHAIGLYYYPGFRSAWYQVEKGQKANDPGETNPFPQAIVVISGSGFATIGAKTVELKAGESYYIPPGAEHVAWTDDDKPLTVLWLAWGEGA